MTTPEEEHKRLAEDFTKLRESILQVHLNWSDLERNVALLLEAILGRQRASIGFAVYYSPSGAETRFKIVDEALRTLILVHPAREALLLEWNSTTKQLRRSRVVRNKIAHGEILTVAANKQQIRLAPPIFDFSRQFKELRMGKIKTVADLLKLQPPGMSPHDVNQIAEDLVELKDRVALFSRAITALQMEDADTLQQIVLALRENRLMRENRAKGDQTPPIPPDPPQSPEE